MSRLWEPLFMAVTKVSKCPKCFGVGKTAKGEVCPRCQGSGEIERKKTLKFSTNGSQ